MTMGTTTAATSCAPAPLPIEKQFAIENALAMALHYIRTDGAENLTKATAKANRALTLLKRANEAANLHGRA